MVLFLLFQDVHETCKHRGDEHTNTRINKSHTVLCTVVYI